MSADRTRRRFPRFEVSTLEEMRGSLLNTSGLFRLSVFGGGGCAFVAFRPPTDFVPPSQVELQFDRISNDKIQSSELIKAELIYVRPYDIMNELMLYGFKFLDGYETRINPFIQSLESWAREGKAPRL